MTAWLKSAWNACCNFVSAGIDWLRNGFSAFLGFFRGIGVGIGNGINLIRQGFQNCINWIQEKISWFGECGQKIITTLVNGIKSVASKPVEAIKGIFKKVRNLLPFSDAKEGPLSTLTLSGQRTMTTFAEGVQLAQGAPSEAISKSLGQAKPTLEQPPIKKIVTKKNDGQDAESSDGPRDGQKAVIIEKLLLNVDFSKIKELPQLLKLVRELEEYANSTGDTAPEPA